MTLHVCNILKGYHKNLYSFILDKGLNNIPLVEIRKLLNHVLVSNQLITNTLTWILRHEMGDAQFTGKYPRGIFPHYLRNEMGPYVKKYGDKIWVEIEQIDAKIPKIRDYKTYKNPDELLDLRVPYKKIIQLARTAGLTEFYERSEYGYYIGSLLNIIFNEFKLKYPIDKPAWGHLWKPIDYNVLDKRMNSFTYNIERAILIKHGLDINELDKVFIHYEQLKDEISRGLWKEEIKTRNPAIG